MNRIGRLCAAVAAVVLLASVALGEPSDKVGEIDFLKTATDFADCMIEYGRDRYGKTHSPLFSNILTREKEPRTTPYPLFAELSDDRKGSLAGFPAHLGAYMRVWAAAYRKANARA